jgi:hypothetical protein
MAAHLSVFGVRRSVTARRRLASAPAPPSQLAAPPPHLLHVCVAIRWQAGPCFIAETNHLLLLRCVCRSPTTCMTMVHWASTRRFPSGSGAGSALSQYGSCALHSQVGDWVPSGNRAGNGGDRSDCTGASVSPEDHFSCRASFCGCDCNWGRIAGSTLA